MKIKILFFAILFFSNLNAQDINLGIHSGFPFGGKSLTDNYGFNFGLDLSALVEIYDSTKVGVATGYSYFFGKTIELPGGGKTTSEGIGIFPLAAALRYDFRYGVYAGGDLGIGIALRDNNIFSFYFQPKIGIAVDDNFDAFTSIKVIDSGNVLGVGLTYKILTSK